MEPALLQRPVCDVLQDTVRLSHWQASQLVRAYAAVRIEYAELLARKRRLLAQLMVIARRLTSNASCCLCPACRRTVNSSVHLLMMKLSPVQSYTAQQLAADVPQVGMSESTSALDHIAGIDKAMSRLALKLAFHAVLSGEVRMYATPGLVPSRRSCPGRMCATQVLQPQQVPALSRLCMQTATCMVGWLSACLALRAAAGCVKSERARRG